MVFHKRADPVDPRKRLVKGMVAEAAAQIVNGWILDKPWLSHYTCTFIRTRLRSIRFARAIVNRLGWGMCRSETGYGSLPPFHDFSAPVSIGTST